MGHLKRIINNIKNRYYLIKIERFSNKVNNKNYIINNDFSLTFNYKLTIPNSIKKIPFKLDKINGDFITYKYIGINNFPYEVTGRVYLDKIYQEHGFNIDHTGYCDNYNIVMKNYNRNNKIINLLKRIKFRHCSSIMWDC